jgi:NAD(P)H-hydrate epimerase
LIGATVLREVPRRGTTSTKFTSGNVFIVGGSRGLTGAPCMTALSAMRAGAGYVTVGAPASLELSFTVRLLEAMVVTLPEDGDGHLDASGVEPVLKAVGRADAVVLGPGLSKDPDAQALARGVAPRIDVPLVVDADGLNILAENMEALAKTKGPRLLTPHPGEMKRLFPNENRPRAELARKFCDQYTVTLLLKGSRTIVAEAGHPLSYNTTGHPGMATGGMGDVLTGVCAALFGQKISPNDAARLGAWLCGRAAEIAIFSGRASEESLLPRDVIDHLGAAFCDLRAG